MVKAIDFLFSTLCTTPFLYGKYILGNFIRFYNHKRRAIFSETVPYDVCIPSLAVYHLVNPSQGANYCLGEDMTHAAWTVWPVCARGALSC